MKENENLSLDKCRKILNKNGKNYSDEQIIAIRNYLSELAQVDFEVFVYNEK